MADDFYGVTDNWDERQIPPMEKPKSALEQLTSLLGMDTPEGAAASLLPTPMALMGPGKGAPILKRLLESIAEKYPDNPIMQQVAKLQVANKYPRLFEHLLPETQSKAPVIPFSKPAPPPTEAELGVGRARDTLTDMFGLDEISQGALPHEPEQFRRAFLSKNQRARLVKADQIQQLNAASPKVQDVYLKWKTAKGEDKIPFKHLYRELTGMDPM